MVNVVVLHCIYVVALLTELLSQVVKYRPVGSDV